MERVISKVVIYVRKSREDETDETLKRQLAVLIDLCKKSGWKYEVFEEVGSSQDIERPELQKMLDKVKGFNYDAIVVADLDRLSRNTGHFGTIKEIIINAGCLVVTPSKTYDFRVQEDDLFSDIQSVLAKNEYQTIKKRLVRGARQSARDGNWLGKKQPLGYKYNRSTKRLEPSEDAPIIKRMFQEYINGLSTTTIAEKFTLEGVNTSTEMIWTSSGISRLLGNEVYIGYSIYGKTTRKNGKRGVKTEKDKQIIVENTHEAIIDKETWDKVQQLKQNRNSRPAVLKLGKHRFSGLIKCAICGSIHSFQTSNYGRKRITSCQTKHYINGSFNKYNVCENKGANLDEFEKLFFTYFSQYIQMFENHIETIKASEKPQQNSSEDKIKTFERQLKKIDQDIKRVQQGFIMEIFTEEEAHTQIKGFKAQKESIEKELERLSRDANSSSTDYLEKVLNRMKEIHNGRDTLPEEVFNEKLRGVVDYILYKKVGESNVEMEVKIIYK